MVENEINLTDEILNGFQVNILLVNIIVEKIGKSTDLQTSTNGEIFRKALVLSKQK